jgi:hypothetical protein
MLSAAGCSLFPDGQDHEAEAQRKLDLARQFEAAASYREAAHEYAIIAEQYPTTWAYRVAVRKAALLYATPQNPAHDDTTARRLIEAVLALDPPEEERQALETLRAVLVSLSALRADSARLVAETDSLSDLSRRQEAALSAQMRRTSDLEQQLIQTVGELNRLKEIDVRASKSRRKR